MTEDSRADVTENELDKWMASFALGRRRWRWRWRWRWRISQRGELICHVKDLHARADDRLISQVPAAEVANMHRFLHFSEWEDTTEAKLALLLTHLLKVPPTKLMASAAKTHLMWNLPAERFDAPDGCEDFVSTLHSIFRPAASQTGGAAASHPTPIGGGGPQGC